MTIPKFLIFNFLTKTYLKHLENFPFLNKRLKSSLTDFMLILAIFLPLFIIIMIPFIILDTSFIDPSKSYWIEVIGILPYSFMTFVMINKDYYRARSIAKRIHGYEIVDYKSEQPANGMQCMIRNITIIIWPIEILIAWIHPNRRLGDLLAGTKVIDIPFLDPYTILEDFKQIKVYKDFRKLLWTSIGVTIFFDFWGWALMLIK